MDQALKQFDPMIAQWFETQVGSPTMVQRAGWPIISGGESVLLSAPTGTGKTLAAFLCFIDRLVRRQRAGTLEDRTAVLYLSPLKALGNDISKNLRRPLDQMNLTGIRIGVRSGDTEASERQRMMRRPPHIFITTPESLYVMLTSKGGRTLLRSVEAVIIDELHAVLDSKRGTHLLLSLERLDALCGKKLQRVGLSATIRPLQRAADCLAGAPAARRVRVVAPEIRKRTDVQVEMPLKDFQVMPEGSVWPSLLRTLYQRAQGARTTLVFTEGRATAEKVAHGINELAGEGFARTHHGCVSKEQRLEAEMQLKSGQLRMMCATSSMELGIDVGEIDLVAQIAVPNAVSRATQRLGRAGHSPGQVSVMRFYPRTQREILDCALTVQAMNEGFIEELRPPELCLDVLAQHLVSMAAMGEWTVDELLHLVRGAWPYREISKEQIMGVLGMLAGDYEHSEDQPARPRVLYDRIHETVSGDEYSRMLALRSGGTIPDRGWYRVMLSDGTHLGELDEEFVFEARLGDRFLLGAFAWQIEKIERDRVIVKPTSPVGAPSPFWKGDGVGRPYETGLRVGARFRGFTQAHFSGRLLRALEENMGLDLDGRLNAARYIESCIEALGGMPDDNTIILEHFSDQAGESQLLVHSVFGRPVNQPLSMLLRSAAQRAVGGEVRVYVNDDGILLHSASGRLLPDNLLDRIDRRGLRRQVMDNLPDSALFAMSFRYNAARALMMGVRKSGRVPLWVQRIKGTEALHRVCAHSEHPLMLETVRDCMEQWMDMAGLEDLFERMASGQLRTVERHVRTPSPLALALRQTLESVELYNEQPLEKGSKVELMDLRAGVKPEREQVAQAVTHIRAPSDERQLHSMLMAEGDLAAGEVEAPIEWLNSLLQQGRALYIEPGLWIACEERELYQRALEQGDRAAQTRLAMRCLRYHGPMEAGELAARYAWDEAFAQGLLEELAGQDKLIRADFGYIPAQIYERAQRLQLREHREMVQTQPPEAYAALLAESIRGDMGGEAALVQALQSLEGVALPPRAWEEAVLPRRVAGYRPQMLDELIARGEFIWRILPEEAGRLAFYPAGRIDWTAEPPEAGAELTPEERRLYEILRRRGASFGHALSQQMGEVAVMPLLLRLMEMGLVSCDSFAPLRRQSAPAGLKARVHQRVRAQSAGRWELAQPVLPLSLEDRLEGIFDRYRILSRETAAREGVSFAEALELLRVWEYVGRVRRGYFVKGMSGAQFVRQGDFEKVTRALKAPSPMPIWLNAADPMQAWGGILKHEREERSFLCVPGSAVALVGGKVGAVLERKGETLRVFESESVGEILSQLVRSARMGQLFPEKRMIVLRKVDPGLGPALEEAGFVREMRDYVLELRR